MRPDEHTTSNESKPRKRRTSLEFYYWERVGNRYYLRYTRFAYIVTIVFGLFVVAMLVGYIIFDSRKSSNRDTKITAPSPSPSASYPVIRQAPVSSPPARVNKPPQFMTPTPSATTSTNKNAKDLLAPQQTPSPQPSTPPP